jgi:HPt (histidine-containing phosphotransfer) domain-containing protein
MSDPEPIPVLDLGVIDALRALDEGAGPGLFEELVDLFVNDAVAHVRALESALATGDARLLERSAHTLKSSSASLGAMQLSELCRALEQVGRNNVLDGAVDLVRAASDACQRACKALGEVRA